MSTCQEIIPSEADSLEKAIQTIKAYSILIVNTLAKYNPGLRNKIISNFIARGITCTENIFLVWKAGSEQDSWILHRALLDRVFYLYYLIKKDMFVEFDNFCFMKTYEAHQKFLDDNKRNYQATESFIQKHTEQKSRYEQLSLNKPKWNPPKAHQIAARMKLDFLYQYGYQYASTHVHPTSEDGEDDLKRLIHIQKKKTLPNAVVVKNSILDECILIRIALHGSNMMWRNFVFDFLDQMYNYVNDYNNTEFITTFNNIAKTWPTHELGKPRRRDS